jgi:hypothetical protein
MVAGRVNSNGSIAEGSGFFVRPLGQGGYLVEFDTNLENVPAVVVKQNYKSWNDFDYGGGDTRDNAVVVAIDHKGFRVLTGGSDGKGVDRNFSFIASVASTQSMMPKLIWGDVNADATIYSGRGFLPTGIGDGVYMLDFEQNFDSLAAVVATQNYRDWNDLEYLDVNTLYNAVIVAGDAGKFKYVTGNEKGSKVDRNCSFVAAGARSGDAPSPRVLFGCIDDDGTIYQTSRGFAVKQEYAGLYTITFEEAFSSAPAVVVTINHSFNQSSWTDFVTYPYPESNTRYNAVLGAVTQNEARVHTGFEGSHWPYKFSFLVVGD